MKDDFENYFLDSMDDNILALENTIGFNYNYAIYLKGEGRTDEAEKYWNKYLEAKKELTKYKRKIHRERNRK